MTLDEAQTFGAFFLATFNSTYSLKEIFFSEDSSGRSCVKVESILPVRIYLTFGKMFVKFIVDDPVFGESASNQNAACVNGNFKEISSPIKKEQPATASRCYFFSKLENNL